MSLVAPTLQKGTLLVDLGSQSLHSLKVLGDTLLCVSVSESHRAGLSRRLIDGRQVLFLVFATCLPTLLVLAGLLHLHIIRGRDRLLEMSRLGALITLIL